MSADNWAECPQCVELGQAKWESRQQEVLDAYGIVTPSEYRSMLIQLDEFAPQENYNLCEDYELRISDGKFHVWYKARCERCGFKHSFTAEEPINMKGDS